MGVSDILASKVNRVERLAIEGHRPIVKKTYFDRAIATGIEVTLKRSIIERQVSDVLSRQSWRGIRNISVRTIASYTSSTNSFAYVEGLSLRDLPERKWPKSGVFRELGRFVAMAESLVAPSVFRGLQISSRKLGQRIRLYKTGSVARRSGIYFCFGDLNLGNIIASRGALVLIDFEFAHLSSAAFDIGMLVAEFDYRAASRAGRRWARQALLQGYNEAGGKLANVMVWRNRLAKHQLKSRSEAGKICC